MADLTPDDGKLRYLTTREARLIDLLRADPDQDEHVVDLTRNGMTVQHPISERLEMDLFDCPALEDASEYANEWGLDDGRYRMKTAINGATYLELIA